MLPYPTNRLAMIYEAISKALRPRRETLRAIVLRRR